MGEGYSGGGDSAGGQQRSCVHTRCAAVQLAGDASTRTGGPEPTSGPGPGRYSCREQQEDKEEKSVVFCNAWPWCPLFCLDSFKKPASRLLPLARHIVPAALHGGGGG